MSLAASLIVSYRERGMKTGLAFQTYQRSLNEAAIFKEGPNGELQTLAVAAGNYGVIGWCRTGVVKLSAGGR